MWTKTGVPLGPSPALQSRKISLGAGPIEPQCLKDILTNFTDPGELSELYKFLPPSLLRQLGKTPFVQVQHKDNTYLIPCFELARAFYFWTGPKMIDFFFSPLQAHHLCQPLRAPTAGNRQRAKMMLVVSPTLQDTLDLPRAYTPLQVTQMAHLLFSPVFAHSFNRLHSSMIGQWGKGVPAHVWLTLELGKAIRVRAEGFPFTYNGKPFFWTCALPERASYFCFCHLDYTALYDTRMATPSVTSDTSSAPPSPGGARARMQVGASISHDSNQAGSSQYAGQQVHVPSDEIVGLPSIRRDKKIIKAQVKQWLKWWINGRPTVLSERAGGRDLDIAKVDLHLDVHRLTYSVYFEAIVTLLRKRNAVKCLAQNTSIPSTPINYCLLPIKFRPATHSPYRVAVAEIVTGARGREGYFYFFQVLASRSLRSGFLYKGDQSQLTPDQLDDLLIAIHRKEDDWRKVIEDFQERLTRKFHTELVILARNHLYVESDAMRCEKEIRSLAGLKKIKTP